MCGRYVLRHRDLHRIGPEITPFLPNFEEFTEHPRYNIAPSQHAVVIRTNAAGKPVLGLLRWGLIPSWTKEKPKLQPINIRGESVATNGMAREAFRRRRGIIPADGFYEWQGATLPKQPYFIHLRDNSVFGFAGVWERWRPTDDAEPIETFAILTTTPNALMASIHNRMPVILKPQDYARWLNREIPGEEVTDLLQPFDAGQMEASRVSSKVNKTTNDGPELIEASSES